MAGGERKKKKSGKKGARARAPPPQRSAASTAASQSIKLTNAASHSSDKVHPSNKAIKRVTDQSVSTVVGQRNTWGPDPGNVYQDNHVHCEHIAGGVVSLRGTGSPRF